MQQWVSELILNTFFESVNELRLQTVSLSWAQKGFPSIPFFLCVFAEYILYKKAKLTKGNCKGGNDPGYNRNNIIFNYFFKILGSIYKF